jgi:hypothetical protein
MKTPLADYPFYIGQWLDVKDSTGSWYDSIGCRAVIVSILSSDVISLTIATHSAFI